MTDRVEQRHHRAGRPLQAQPDQHEDEAEQLDDGDEEGRGEHEPGQFPQPVAAERDRPAEHPGLHLLATDVQADEGQQHDDRDQRQRGERERQGALPRIAAPLAQQRAAAPAIGRSPARQVRQAMRQAAFVAGQMVLGAHAVTGAGGFASG